MPNDSFSISQVILRSCTDCVPQEVFPLQSPNIICMLHFCLQDHCASVKLHSRSITAVSLELDNVTPSQYHLRSILPSPRSLCKCQVTQLFLSRWFLLDCFVLQQIMYCICLSDMQINIMLQIMTYSPRH